ncbi:hypothetical protein ACWDG1_46415 [Streptomyces sp. NPDC001177]
MPGVKGTDAGAYRRSEGRRVGLFWIDEPGAYVGAPAQHEGASEVLLTDGGVQVRGDRSASLPWEEVQACKVSRVPVRSGGLLLGTALSWAAAVLSTSMRLDPLEITVIVQRVRGKDVHVVVNGAVLWGYSAQETVLSQRLLDRIVAGEVPFSTVSLRDQGTGRGKLSRSEREGLLRRWLEG